MQHIQGSLENLRVILNNDNTSLEWKEVKSNLFEPDFFSKALRGGYLQFTSSWYSFYRLGYFELRKTHLFYFLDQYSIEKPVSHINLDGYNVTAGNETKFEIRLIKPLFPTYYFRAQNKVDFIEWITDIYLTIKALNNEKVATMNF